MFLAHPDDVIPVRESWQHASYNSSKYLSKYSSRVVSAPGKETNVVLSLSLRYLSHNSSHRQINRSFGGYKAQREPVSTGT